MTSPTASSPVPDAATAAVLLNGAIEQIRFAREYTLALLEQTPHERWFEIPGSLPTNIAWQVGHLAVSQYGLLLFRLRGRRPEDLDLIPGPFRRKYGRQTTPDSDASAQPNPDELLQRLHRVFETALDELRQTDSDVLLKPVDPPWTAWPIRLGAVLFCPLHEHVHAGQIGLIRRALGLDPIR